MKTGNHAIHQATWRQFSMAAKGEKKLNHNKKKEEDKKRILWMNCQASPVSPSPVLCPVQSSMATVPTLNGCDSSGDKRNRTAVEYGKIEKERSDEITVGTEEGGKYWQRRREDRTWWLNSPGWMPKLSSTKVRHAHTHNICKNHCIHKKEKRRQGERGMERN